MYFFDIPTTSSEDKLYLDAIDHESQLEKKEDTNQHQLEIPTPQETREDFAADLAATKLEYPKEFPAQNIKYNKLQVEFDRKQT